MIFLIRQLVRSVSVIVSCRVLNCVHRLCPDEVHTTFFDLRLVSITILQEGFLCLVCLNFLFTQATYTQDRLRHVHHTEIKPFRLTANYQPDLSLSVFLERFSVGTSETSRTIRQRGVPKPTWDTLTEAPLSIITSPSSRSTQPLSPSLRH